MPQCAAQMVDVHRAGGRCQAEVRSWEALLSCQTNNKLTKPFHMFAAEHPMSKVDSRFLHVPWHRRT